MYSNDSQQFVAAINHYIEHTNRTGKLDPSLKVFMALALAQSTKSIGCCLSEICSLTGLGKRKVKTALSQFARFGMLEMGSTKYAIPVMPTSSIRMYLPSKWAKGNTVERSGGRCVPLYKLAFNGGKIFLGVVHEITTEFTADNFVSQIQAQINRADSKLWLDYVRFGRILLSELTSIVNTMKWLYDENMPTQIQNDIWKLSSVIDLVLGNCDKRSFVSDMFGKIRHYLARPLIVQ